MKYVLDTNAFIAALNGVPEVTTALNALDPSDEILLSAVVFAELRYGALCSMRREENLARIEALNALFGFADVTRTVAMRFADVKAELRIRGIAKSDADLLIAATALAEGAILVTGDKALLDGEIRDLRVENWTSPGRPAALPTEP
ncbi:MAG: PIN domain-containing protein [Deltaproteobacteria bacterium]|nr:PIN domain-containing protein [Deltaproteobacteria bacterium]